MKCEICSKEIMNQSDAHNGKPLVTGVVCSNCNWVVIKERIKLLRTKDRTAFEGVEIRYSKEMTNLIKIETVEAAISILAELEKIIQVANAAIEKLGIHIFPTIDPNATTDPF
jgi:hypothetical protein